ncbi:glycosyltransferase family 2 protein [Phocaeicola sp. HCN-40430]|uniref:glycosyltransferase family 2 protein n=1 Tax=Phocaeicola sp. HCN-40430 TaxID=3134664 RepID=UPI0030BF1658
MDKANPTVSVIVPNYNYARYLEARLQSILNQSFQDFELILLDDASTDNSAEVLDKYRNDFHVSHIVVNEKNTGSPFRQWMKGILLAKGEWVWIAEADDLCEPDFLETCVKQVNQYSNVAVCMVASRFIDEDGDMLQGHADYWASKKPNVSACFFPGKAYAAHNMYWNNCIINASGVLFRRSYAVKLYDSVFLNMRYSGDWVFWFQMLLQGNMVEVYRELNYFRQHTSKVSVEGINSGKRIKEDIDTYVLMENTFPDIGIYKRRLAHGQLYRKIKKVKNVEKQAELSQYLYEKLGGKASDLRLFHINKYLRWVCPWIITLKRDRLKK